MSRVSIREMAGIMLNQPELQRIFEYVSRTFSLTARHKLPFQPMAPNPIIGDPIRPHISTGYQNSLANTQGIEFFLKKIFDLTIRTHQFQTVISTDGNINMLEPKNAAMYSNIANYDYFSPVPFSEPDDPLGFYTRDNKARPRFLFEIRYAQDILENIDNTAECYNDAFRNACIQQFTAAFNNWP